MKVGVALLIVAGTAACLARASAQDPPPITADLSEPAIAGYRNGLIYLRDRRDFIRLYPHAELNLDAHGFFGARVDEVPKSQAGVDLGPRVLVRRASLELVGEVFERIGFDVGMDLVANPAIDGARADATDTRVALEDAWASFDAGRGLVLMLGVFQAPFSLENRSFRSDLAMLERNLAIRSFVVPGGKVLGGAVQGAARLRVVHWALGGFAAERIAPNEFDRSVSAMGRLGVRPLAARQGHALRGLQLGVSARVGSRNPRDAHGDAPALTTGQGFALWRPTRVDDQGRTLHVVLSRRQWALGGELVVPFRGLIVRGEAYWVSRETYERVDGDPATQALRAGNMRGVGWYMEISGWLLELAGQTTSAPPALGNFPHVEHLELARTAPEAERYGFEIAVLGAGVNARYDAASRAGTPDGNTAGTRIDAYQLGIAVNYWHTRHFRLSINPNVYWTPAGNNLAGVPGNLGEPAERDAGAHKFVELGARTLLMF